MNVPVRLMVRVCAVLVPALAAACAPRTGPAAPPPTESTLRLGSSGRMEIRTEVGRHTRSFGVHAQEAWDVLPGVFERLDVTVTLRNRMALQMGNEGYVARRVEDKRMSTYLDCGTSLSGVLADAYDVTLQLLVQLKPTSERDTEVTVTVDGLASPRSTSGPAVHCTSKSVLEERFSDLVAEALLARVG